MKSGLRKSKASGSTKRRVEDILLGRGRYTPAKLAAKWDAFEQARDAARRI